MSDTYAGEDIYKQLQELEKEKEELKKKYTEQEYNDIEPDYDFRVRNVNSGKEGYLEILHEDLVSFIVPDEDLTNYIYLSYELDYEFEKIERSITNKETQFIKETEEQLEFAISLDSENILAKNAQKAIDILMRELKNYKRGRKE